MLCTTSIPCYTHWICTPAHIQILVSPERTTERTNCLTQDTVQRYPLGTRTNENRGFILTSLFMDGLGSCFKIFEFRSILACIFAAAITPSPFVSFPRRIVVSSLDWTNLGVVRILVNQPLGKTPHKIEVLQLRITEDTIPTKQEKKINTKSNERIISNASVLSKKMYYYKSQILQIATRPAPKKLSKCLFLSQ